MSKRPRKTAHDPTPATRASAKALPDVHPDLAGFDVRLNAFGGVDMTISIDRLNAFLDRVVDDPKLRQWGIRDDED